MQRNIQLDDEQIRLLLDMFDDIDYTELEPIKEEFYSVLDETIIFSRDNISMQACLKMYTENYELSITTIGLPEIAVFRRPSDIQEGIFPATIEGLELAIKHIRDLEEGQSHAT